MHVPRLNSPKKLPALHRPALPAALMISLISMGSTLNAAGSASHVHPPVAPTLVAEGRVLIECDGTSESLVHLRQKLELSGARVVHVFVPDFIIVEKCPPDVAAWTGVLSVHRDKIASPAIGDGSVEARAVIDFWNSMFGPAVDKRTPADEPHMAEAREDARGSDSCVRAVPADLMKSEPFSPQGAPYGAGFWDTAEFMMGSVAVGVFLMESAGSAYDWTEEEVTQSLQGVYQAMDFWVLQGGTSANLSFVFDVHVRVPTTYEPIQRYHWEENLWIAEAMATLGYPASNAYQQVATYNNDLRASVRTHWAFSMFIVDSNTAVAAGRFPDGSYAWATGPYFSMSRRSTFAYNAPNYFKAVPAHETGHIFYATDEYNNVSESAGYLNAHDHDGALCIMNRNSLGAVCAGSRRQLGWEDSDRDGTHDILDIEPQIVDLTVQARPGPAETVYCEGTGIVTTFPNSNPHGRGNGITLHTISRVECSAVPNEWLFATPDDGSFDSGMERFGCVLPLPDCGVNTIRARSLDERLLVGRTSVRPHVCDHIVPGNAASRSVSSPAAIHTYPHPFNSLLNIDYHVPGAASVTMGIYDVAGRFVATLVDNQWTPAGAHKTTWDGRGFASGVYFVVLSAGPTEATQKIILLR